MREYKFRGHDGADWIYSESLDYDKETDTYYMKDDEGKWIKVNNVGQFTGLYDKNGTEIYNDDIVKRAYAESSIFTGVVTFDNGTYYLVKNVGENGIEYTYLSHQYDSEKLEVVGNTYENGDLIN